MDCSRKPCSRAPGPATHADPQLRATQTSNNKMQAVQPRARATTHTDLQLRARTLGVEVRVVHDASIISAVGACGLQPYCYGEEARIPI